MMLLSRLDAWGKGAWFALLIAAFWVAWPIGLALMAFLAGSGRLQAWAEAASPARGRWRNLRAATCQGMAGSSAEMRSSGNQAFDQYRHGELRRLEEEQLEFSAFLERLRRARDKEEFDRFMAENGRPAPSPDSPTKTGSTEAGTMGTGP